MKQPAKVTKSNNNAVIGVGAGLLLGWLLFRRKQTAGGGNLHFDSTYYYIGGYYNTAFAVDYVVTDPSGQQLIVQPVGTEYGEADLPVSSGDDYTITLNPVLYQVTPI
jgi:hypothetical protein